MSCKDAGAPRVWLPTRHCRVDHAVLLDLAGIVRGGTRAHFFASFTLQQSQEDEDYWPPYGCTIAFAVLDFAERPLGRRSRERPEENGEDVVLEISVDGEPLRSRLFRKHHGKPGSMSLADFRTAVKNLLPP